MARRGFLAEINYQMQQAEKQRQREQAAAFRAQQVADREVEKARREAERTQAAAAKASAQEEKAAAKAAAEAYAAARLAEVEAKNAHLASTYAEIDSMLAATLSVDDYVDLNDLRAVVAHPPFEPGEWGVPTQPMPELVYAPQPQYVEPPAPTGLFASKKKHEEVIAQAQAQHQADLAAWHAQATAQYEAHIAEQARREQVEQQRLAQLAQLQAEYEAQYRQREADVAAQNSALDDLINGLAFDVETAIQDYIGIVMSNSVWPDAFPVNVEHRFDLASRELTLVATVPAPSSVPNIKEYRYVKSKDEEATTLLTAKAQKDRYTSAVWQVAVRVVHEVFEADRSAKINSISLTVGASHISPSTGLHETVPFAVVAADRATFTAFDLTSVVPLATLQHLGAALSKSPFDMTPADTSRGVRVRGQ
jgi:restriction system protein